MVTKTQLLLRPRADNISASDRPHEKYMDDGRPVLSSTPIGKIVKKKVTRTTVHCPDCGTPARRLKGEPICPDCGLVCQSKDSNSKEIIIDPKAAGRVDADDSGGTTHA